MDAENFICILENRAPTALSCCKVVLFGLSYNSYLLLPYEVDLNKRHGKPT